MIDFLKFLLETYPWFATPFLVASSAIVIVLLVLGAVASLQGRQFKVGPVTIGEKPPEPPPPAETPIINVHPGTFTDQQLRKIGEELAERVREIGKEDEGLAEAVSKAAEKDPNRMEDTYPVWPDMYEPPAAPGPFAYAFNAKLDIEKKLRRIVLADGDSWAGAMLSSGEVYYDLVVQHRLVSDDLIRYLESFYKSIEPYLAGIEPYLYDDSFFSLMGLTTHIVRELDEIIESLEPKWE